MKIKVTKQIKSPKGVLVLPIFQEETSKMPALWPKSIKEFIKKRVKQGDFEAKKWQKLTTYFDKADLHEKLLVIGLGEKKDFREKHYRDLGGHIGKYVKQHKEQELTIAMTEGLMDHLQGLLEGVLFSQYSPDKLKSKKEGKGKANKRLQKISILADKTSKQFDQAIERAEIFAEASEFVKDLVNNPSNIVDADFMAREAKGIASQNSYKCKVLSETQLRKSGWGGVLAVNQGSDNDAKCVILEYKGAKNKKEAPIVLVGKGIIFDAGGYNLKPTQYIETMHQDMAGAATVLGVFKTLKALGVKRNVIGIAPMAENLVSGKSYRPSDIITMLSGETVEITNTDAEGRLILADGIHHATKLKPQAIITIATLTGAVGIALGDRFAGLIANDDDLRTAMQDAGHRVDECGWPLPLVNCYRKKMDSKVADHRNYDTQSGRYAGTAKAAAFLERFVGDHKWCHIDIGGTAFTTDPKSYQSPGATAHGLKMLVEYLES